MIDLRSILASVNLANAGTLGRVAKQVLDEQSRMQQQIVANAKATEAGAFQKALFEGAEK